MRGRAGGTRAVPIPEEERDGESRMRVRPGGVEIHINGERTPPPNAHGREKCPLFSNIFSGKREREQKPQKTVNCRTQCHGHEIGNGETVGGNGHSQKVQKQNEQVSEQKKREPKNGWTDREQITDVARFRVLFRQKLAIPPSSGLRKIQIGVPPVFLEVQAVFYQGSTRIGIVSDSIAMNDGIDQGQGKNEEQKENMLERDSALRGL